MQSRIKRIVVLMMPTLVILATFVGGFGIKVEGQQSTTETNAATKQVLWRIDVGNVSSYTDSEGRIWSSDKELFAPERAFAESRGKPLIAGVADPTIYHTYRGNVGGKTPQAERILSFEIPVRGHRKADLAVALR